jgi:hypothetical protein
MTNSKIEYWVIPPEADAEFVAGKEDVLETYEQPYDPRRPVVCMDEQPVQLPKETRTPIAATVKHAKRVDHEYERARVARIFMLTEPLAGWGEVAVRHAKTKVDWAMEMARLLEGRYAHCPKVILVCDNLNTHTKGAFYEAFEPERARQLVRRTEFQSPTTTITNEPGTLPRRPPLAFGGPAAAAGAGAGSGEAAER